jgi:hypothetical protein
MQGELTWVVGPWVQSGAILEVARKVKGSILAGRIEVGTVTGVGFRATVRVAPNLRVRAVARLGTSGIDVEVGVAKQFLGDTMGYFGVQAGLAVRPLRVFCLSSPRPPVCLCDCAC